MCTRAKRYSRFVYIQSAAPLQLNKFVLRNPQRIRVGGDECTPSAHDATDNEAEIVDLDRINQPQLPTCLNTHYAVRCLLRWNYE